MTPTPEDLRWAVLCDPDDLPRWYPQGVPPEAQLILNSPA